MMKCLAVLFAVLLAVSLLFTVLYVELSLPGLMEKRFELFAEAPGDYGQLAKDITGYLNGGNIELSYFQAHEQAHMADVRSLTALLRQVLLALWLCVACLGFFLRQKAVSKTIAIALFSVLIAVLLVIAYAFIDFDGLFILFHKLAFTNDLWLLNPATDYLIQLMPIGFFMTYALSIGLIWLLLMILCILFIRRPHGLFSRFQKTN